jgi:hypothetical protein
MRAAAAVLAIAAALVALPSAAKAQPGAIAGARIALRCDNGRLLIVGPQADSARVEKLASNGLSRLTPVPFRAALAPGEAAYAIGGPFFRDLFTSSAERAPFLTREQWRVYPGEGPPAVVEVETSLLLYHPDSNSYLGALVRFVRAMDARRFAGLRATAYLAFARHGPAVAVSGASLEAVARPNVVAAAMLLNRAREVARDEGWGIERNIEGEEKLRIQEMNRRFRTAEPVIEMRAWHWNSTQGALLFVEAVWSDATSKSGLFAVDAIMRDGTPPAILSFDHTKAAWMRMFEFRDRDWSLGDGAPAFLNAWQIGADRYVLTYAGGYEGYSVDLRRIDAGGVVSVLDFGQ